MCTDLVKISFNPSSDFRPVVNIDNMWLQTHLFDDLGQMAENF